MSSDESNSSSSSQPNTPHDAESSTGESKNYLVASHTVRITKFGYAVDPTQLSHPEVMRNYPADLRWASQDTFNPEERGHLILDVIRGFWSQPAFPNGQLITKTKLKDVTDVLREFSKYPFYPHKKNFGRMSRHKEPVAQSRSAPKGIVRIDVGSQWTDITSLANPQIVTQPSSPNVTNDLSHNIRDKFRTFSPTPSTSNGKGSKSSSGILSILSPRSRSPAKSPTPPANAYLSWIPQNEESMYDVVADLCRTMETIFDQEERIINIDSPCLVMGDIHGNLSDLRIYERSLWPKAPVCCSKNYLFLGDYVDRGDFSIESVLYLFAMKSLVPKRFFMLRGNHEVAVIQKQYTFSRECELKFGTNLGRKLWRLFNRVFDVMPIAAIVDDKIFCAHGGIPRTISHLDTLRSEIPRPLDNPEMQCPSAWEILWNDPVTDQELISIIEMDNATPYPPGTNQHDHPDREPVSETMNQPENPSSESTTLLNTPADRNINANTALSMDPPSAFSYYIRADDTPTSEPSTSLPRIPIPNPSSSQDDSDSSIRTVPSDTSSIASTSPQQIINDGFVANIKRGTAYLFSDQAIDKFLKLNKLSHVIRAHEVIPTGFAFHGNGRVITIFSTSKYCGLNNQAACALINQERIRIMQLDTADGDE